MLFSCIALSAGSLAIGFFFNDLMFLAGLSLAFGAVWAYTQRRDWNRLSMIWLGLAVFAGVCGIIVEANAGWMLSGVTFSLLAWDLTEFQKRLGLVYVKSDAASMEKRHISRLGILVAATAGFFLLTIFIQLKISLALVILLAFVLALGLAQLYFRFMSNL
jgi:hypothetical protein